MILLLIRRPYLRYARFHCRLCRVRIRPAIAKAHSALIFRSTPPDPSYLLQLFPTFNKETE
jgi:hypothetical protein